jgi:hypothetical protein
VPGRLLAGIAQPEGRASAGEDHVANNDREGHGCPSPGHRRWDEALVIPGTSAGINVGGHIYAGQGGPHPGVKREAIAGYGGDALETPPTVRKAPLVLAGVSDYEALVNDSLFALAPNRVAEPS